MVGDTELLGGFYVSKKYMSIFQKIIIHPSFEFQKKGRPVLPPTHGFSNGVGHNSDAIRWFSAKLARLILKVRGASYCERDKNGIMLDAPGNKKQKMGACFQQ